MSGSLLLLLPSSEPAPLRGFISPMSLRIQLYPRGEGRERLVLNNARSLTYPIRDLKNRANCDLAEKAMR
jgi:hypothetical protein